MPAERSVQGETRAVASGIVQSVSVLNEAQNHAGTETAVEQLLGRMEKNKCVTAELDDCALKMKNRLKCNVLHRR